MKNLHYRNPSLTVFLLALSVSSQVAQAAALPAGTDPKSSNGEDPACQSGTPTTLVIKESFRQLSSTAPVVRHFLKLIGCRLAMVSDSMDHPGSFSREYLFEGIALTGDEPSSVGTASNTDIQPTDSPTMDPIQGNLKYTKTSGMGDFLTFSALDGSILISGDLYDQNQGLNFSIDHHAYFGEATIYPDFSGDHESK